MVLSTRAIVFSAIKYSEADLIVTCFTEEVGIKSYLLRGILKSRKGKLRVSLFQPLTILEIEAIHKDKGTLERIREAKIIDPFKTLHTDVVKSSMVMFLAEMLKNSIQEESPNPELFEYIEQALHWLDAHDSTACFHILFLLKLTAYLGFYPDATYLESPYFNLLEGSFEQNPLGDYSQSGPTIEAFKRFFGIDFDTLNHLSLPKNQRLDTLNLLLLYYQLHLQGYKNPKSLKVLNQLFT